MSQTMGDVSRAEIQKIVKGILATWNGEKSNTLSGNKNFNAIMERCQGANDERPQIIWFVDPINIGSSEMVTVNQLVDIVESIAGIKLRRNYNLAAPKGVRGRSSDNTLRNSSPENLT